MTLDVASTTIGKNYPASRRSFLLGLLASGFVVACGSGSRETGSDATDATTPVEPPTPIEHGYLRVVPAEGSDWESIVAADRMMGAALFTELATIESGNVVFSPYSIAAAFSMAGVGARKQTLAELRAALGIEIDDAAWHQARNALDVAVRTPGSVPEGIDPLELDIANAPFGQIGFEFVDDFVRTLAEQYGADLELVDFVADPEGAREQVNVWVAEQTRDRITELLPDGSVTDMTRLILVNTVFFQGKWVHEFAPGRTEPATFTRVDNSAVDVETMHGSVRTSYGEGEGWEMIRLPYFGGASMTIIVPDSGRFDEVEARIGTGLLDEARAIRNEFQVDLSMPKFNFATPTSLIPLFEKLGVIDAFTTAADFSGMSTDADLYLSGAFHRATIEVDEYGTTATAATALLAGVTSAPPPASLAIDRPFLFVIEHDQTGEPLFLGRVLDPAA